LLLAAALMSSVIACLSQEATPFPSLDFAFMQGVGSSVAQAPRRVDSILAGVLRSVFAGL
jgi:hypothetical protein